MAHTPAASESANVNATQEHGKHKDKGATHTEAATSPAATENANATVNEGDGEDKNQRAAHAEAAMKTGSPNPAATAGTSAVSGTAKIKSGTVGKNGKTVNVQKIKAAHTSFRAQPKPEKVQTVTYNQNYRIVAPSAGRGRGMKYSVSTSLPGTIPVGTVKLQSGRTDRWRLLLLQ
jgi:hypothetical protein